MTSDFMLHAVLAACFTSLGVVVGACLAIWLYDPEDHERSLPQASDVEMEMWRQRIERLISLPPEDPIQTLREKVSRGELSPNTARRMMELPPLEGEMS